MVASLLTILGGIVAVVVGGIAIYEFLKKNNVPGAVIAGVLAAIVIAALILTSLTQNGKSAQSQNSPSIASATTPATTISSATPTDSPPTSPTTTVSSPPPTTEPSPVPTEPTPQLAPSETVSENFPLQCDCSDPIVVTVTKIEIQPQQNRMIWFLTFYNNSQNGADATFRQFYLEKGDQVNYPTTGDQTIYYATGEAVSTGLTLQAGETQQTTLTFSFVPYKDIPYTLSSDLGGLFNGVLAYNVPFSPKVIQF